MKKLAVVIAGLLALTGCSSVETENVSLPVQTEEAVQDTRPSDDDVLVEVTPSTDEGELESVDAPIVEEEVVQEDVQVSEPVEYIFSSEIVDDSICKLKEDSGPRRRWADVPATGFPLNTYGATVSQFGTAKVKVVFLEWEDLRGTQADYDYHVEELNKANDFYRVVSEGKFGFDISFEPEWILVDGSYKDSYFTADMTHAEESSAPRMQQRIDKFIKATDAKVDYSGVDVIFFGIPTAKTVIEEGGFHVFGDGNWVFANTNEGTILNIFAFGERVFSHVGQNQGWAWFAHEFGHVLKMPDLADETQGRNAPDMYVNTPFYGFDVMANQDAGTQGLSAWMKWLQGWLDDSQVTCIDADNVDEEFYKLDEANIVGGKNEMLVIRLSDTQALIVESRRWDSRFDLPIAHSRDGVIVYLVDVTRGHWQGPLRLLSPRDITQYLSQENVWPDWRVLDVIMFKGDSITFGGVTVEVKQTSMYGDIVSVSR